MINQRQLEADNYINYAAYCTSHSPHPVIIPLFRRPSQSCCHNLSGDSKFCSFLSHCRFPPPLSISSSAAGGRVWHITARWQSISVCVFGASYNVKICPKDKWIKAGKNTVCLTSQHMHSVILRPVGHMLTIRHVQSRCVYLKWRNADGSSSARLHCSFWKMLKARAEPSLWGCDDSSTILYGLLSPLH